MKPTTIKRLERLKHHYEVSFNRLPINPANCSCMQMSQWDYLSPRIDKIRVLLRPVMEAEKVDTRGSMFLNFHN